MISLYSVRKQTVQNQRYPSTWNLNSMNRFGWINLVILCLQTSESNEIIHPTKHRNVSSSVPQAKRISMTAITDWLWMELLGQNLKGVTFEIFFLCIFQGIVVPYIAKSACYI